MIKTKLIVLLLYVTFVFSCPDNCNNCDAQGTTCFACRQNYELSSYKTCISNIIDKCIFYGPQNQCYVCQPTYELISNKCVKQYSGCTEKVFEANTCNECKFGKVLVNGFCVGSLNCARDEEKCQGCAAGFELSNGICIDKSSGCLNRRNEDGVCQSCASGFKMIGYQCVRQDTYVPYCYVYYNNQACEKCKSGYTLFQKYCLLTQQIRAILLRKSTIEKTVENILLQIKNYNPQKNLNNDLAAKSSNIAFCRIQNGNICSICNNGYILTKSKNCLKVSRLCGDFNPQTGDCSNCQFGLQNTNGKCIDKFCLKWTQERCESCSTNYRVNLNGLCQYLDPNCQILKQNVCQSCKISFFLNLKRACLKLPNNCKFANIQTENCSQCMEGYFIKNKECVKFSVLCNTFDQKNGFCLTCINGYNLNNGTCLDLNCKTQNDDNCIECRQNFRVSTSKLCTFFDPNCLNLGPISCLACPQGFTILSGVCTRASVIAPTNQFQRIQNSFNTRGNNILISNCKQFSNNVCKICSNRYYLSLDLRCLPVNALCLGYNNQGSCTSCYPSYTLSNELCIIKVDLESACRVRNSAGRCSQCNEGYYLESSTNKCKQFSPFCKTSNTTNGQCLSCYSGYVVSSGNCVVFFKDTNCRQYDNDNICKKCSTTYFFDQTTSKCKSVSPFCKSFNALNGQCTSCFDGYKVSLGQCSLQNISTNDLNCKSLGPNNFCLQCYPGFYTKGGKCEKISLLCKTSSPLGMCLSCYFGYSLSLTGECVIVKRSEQGDLNCKQFSDSTKSSCRVCYEGYYVKGNTCAQYNPLCKTINIINGDCLSCYSGYSLSSDNCVIQQQTNNSNITMNDPYCLQFTSSFCSKCSEGFFTNSKGSCEQLDPYCKSHNMTTGGCLTCYDGFSLSNSKCIIATVAVIPFCVTASSTGICLVCSEGYFLKNNQCKAVSITCGSYNKKTGNCTSCINGYFLQNDECIFPAFGIDPACDNYLNGYCNRCVRGFYIKNYICVQVNRFCIQFDYNINNCIRCAVKTPQGSECV